MSIDLPKFPLTGGKQKTDTVVTVMQSNMLHYASLLLFFIVWMTRNAVGMQEVDRQLECVDQMGCGIATATLGCEVDFVATRCPKTCGSCPGEEAICEDADPKCELLFEQPEVTGVSYYFLKLLRLILNFYCLLLLPQPEFLQNMCDTGLNDICRKSCNICT